MEALVLSISQEFLWIEGGVALPRNRFHRNIILTIDKIEEFRQMHGNVGIYTTAYRYKQGDQKGELWADFFYNDFDNKDLINPDPYIAEAGWRKVVEDVRHAVSVYDVFMTEQIRFYFSGKKGISLLIHAECIGYKPHEYLNEIFKQMVMEVKTYCPNDTLDTRIYDRVRLWRLINSRHEDSGFYKVPLTYQEVVSKSLIEVKELASTMRKIEIKNPAPVAKAIKKVSQLIKDFKPNRIDDAPGRRLKFVPPCVDNILNFQIAEGRRNNSAAALANFFKQFGKPYDETCDLMNDWNNKCCVPSLPASELLSTVRSAYTTNKTWGCGSMIALSECEPTKCKFASRRKKGQVNKHG